MTTQYDDFRIEDQGTIVLVTPLTEGAREWVDANVQLEGWQWLGGSFAVDHRMAQALIDGIEDEGFAVRRGR
jgi:hypothetical protein